MIWALVACAAVACAYTGAHAQPLTCTTDEQCEKGFYCDRDVAYTCRRCLNCEQLKRDPPLVPSPCIKSVADCGSCITGLVEDIRGDVSLECVPPYARSGAAAGAIPAYAWVIISVVALLLFALVVFIVTYVLRNTYTFKILASTRASVQSPRGASAGLNGVDSAPDLPPPYNAHYSAVRPTSPPPDRTHDDAHSHGEESSWPFIKRTPSIQAASHGGARESAGSQAARVYSNPHYVRGPQLPPSYNSAGVVTLPASDDERDAPAHDEDTMESTWTPSDDHHDNNNAPSELSSQLEAARGTALIRAPHHQPCGWQDSNNRSAGEAEGGAAGSSSAPAFVINVVQTIHTQAPPRHAQQP